MEDQVDQNKSQKVFRKQPILCPWITSQPYHSSLWNKNRAPNSSADPSVTNRFLTSPWNNNRQMSMGISRVYDKSLPSIQQSSSQFFYFLRLMQLFPDTHPATLHTVLALCKNDFFCAVDKLLYAKRCKLLCYKKNLVKKSPQSRNKCICNDGRINKNELKQTSLSSAVGNSSAATSSATSAVSLNLSMNEQTKRKFNLLQGVDGCKTILQRQELSEPPPAALAEKNTFAENAEDLSTLKNMLQADETLSPK